MQDVDTLLQALARRLGFEALDFDRDGVCSLAFEERFTVTLERDDDNGLLHLYCTLGAAPEDPLDQLGCFAALLRANLFGRGTGGAALGFEPDSGTIMLTRALALGQLDAEALQTEFGLFVQAAEAWSQRVTERFWEDPDEPAAADLPDDGPDHPLFIKV